MQSPVVELPRVASDEIGTLREDDWSHQLYESKPWLQDLDVLTVQLCDWTLCFTADNEDDRRHSDVAELERWYRHDGAGSRPSISAAPCCCCCPSPPTEPPAAVAPHHPPNHLLLLPLSTHLPTDPPSEPLLSLGSAAATFRAMGVGVSLAASGDGGCNDH